MFKMISNESAQKTPCRFLLQADPGDYGIISGLQYYGFRRDKNTVKNVGLLDSLREYLLGREDDRNAYGISGIEKNIENAKTKFKEEGYTNGWHEWAGIDPQNKRAKAGGRTFEIDVETQLGRPPRLKYNTPYILYNRATDCHLAADVTDDAKIGGRIIRLSYYTRFEKNFRTFVFLEAYRASTRSTIHEGDNVELHLCDSNNVPIGQVTQNRNDQSTLAVEINDSEMDFLFVTNNS